MKKLLKFTLAISLFAFASFTADAQKATPTQIKASAIRLVSKTDKFKTLAYTATIDSVAKSVFSTDSSFLHKSKQFVLSNLNTAPSSASATGTKGEIRFTANAMYVCIATNTWVKTTLATF